MAVKLSETHLPQLLSWLEQYFPHTFAATAELKSHLRGQIPDLECFVDRWPHPQAVVARVDPEKDPRVSRDKKAQIVDCIFGLTEEAVIGLLKDPRVIAWNCCTILTVTDLLKPVVLAVSGEMGKTATVFPAQLLKATPQDLKPIPLPNGVTAQPASRAEVNTIHSNWRFSSRIPGSFIEHYLRHEPSLYLVTDSGQHVGHVMGSSCGTLGMLHVNPEFRGKGYSKVMVSQLAQKYFDRGDDALSLVAKQNDVSQHLHKSLGFKTVPGVEVYWIWCD